MESCECGCGGQPAEGKRFVHGHWSRSPAAKAMFAARRKVDVVGNTSGLCRCGCGATTPIAKENHPERGYYAGQHTPYMPGHGVRGHTGPNAPRWKGGRNKRRDGYINVYAPEHPSADKDGYVLEHRLVAEQTIGRHLYAHEAVHHLNGVKDDNRPENLQVMNRREHAQLHPYPALQRYFASEDRTEERRAAGRKGASARWQPAPAD